MATLKKNLFYSSITSILKFYSGSLIFILIARYITVSDFGLLNFGFSLGLIVGTSAEFGYSLMASRDIPQKSFKIGVYIHNTLIQKSIISLLVIALFIVYLGAIFNGQDLSIGYIFIAYGISSSFIAYYQSLFRARNYFQFELYSTAINTILITVIIVLLIKNEWDINQISFALLVSKLIQMLVVTLMYHLKFKSENTFKIDWKIQRYLTKNSWSFGLHFIIGTLYFQIDTQMLNYFWGSEEVGLYQAPFKFIMLILICFEVVFQVYIPYIAEQFKKSIQFTITNILDKLLKYLIAISLLAFVFIISFNELLIDLIFGESYSSGAPLMPILAAMVVIRVIASVYGILLTVGDFQNYRVRAVFFSLMFSVISNFYFIPQYGIYGAAVVSLLTHLVLVLVYLYFIKKTFNSSLISSYGKLKLLLSLILLFSFFFVDINWIVKTLSVIVFAMAFLDLKFEELKSLLIYHKKS